MQISGHIGFRCGFDCYFEEPDYIERIFSDIEIKLFHALNLHHFLISLSLQHLIIFSENTELYLILNMLEDASSYGWSLRNLRLWWPSLVLKGPQF